MNLCLDFGNTRTKIAVFNGDEPVDEQAYDHFGIAEFDGLLQRFDISAGICCSVAHAPEKLLAQMEQKLPRFLRLDQNTPLPLAIDYDTPQTLGPDRIAAAAGAHFLKPGCNCLVIDAGTAITLDFVSSDGVYRGGNISPGAQMRLKALNFYTEKLPLVELSETKAFLGKSTAEAILNGVVCGIEAEISHYRTQLGEEFPELFVFLTGGDCFYFAKRLKFPIFVVPNLLLYGLNSILNHNLCRTDAQ